MPREAQEQRKLDEAYRHKKAAYESKKLAYDELPQWRKTINPEPKPPKRKQVEPTIEWRNKGAVFPDYVQQEYERITGDGGDLLKRVDEGRAMVEFVPSDSDKGHMIRTIG